MNDEWQSIETAPYNKVVMVTGKSGYSTVPYFIINAYREHGWHQGDWNGPNNERLADFGWEPTHWKPLLDLPKEKT